MFIAGIPVRQVAGSNTSVYMGSFCRDWTDILNRDLETLPFSQATGTGQALLANRLSYFYDLKGPSISIDTACSSSLVAVHLACQSLRTGESKQAIVGGANVILSHETMISMSRMRCLSLTSAKTLETDDWIYYSGFYHPTGGVIHMTVVQTGILEVKEQHV